MEIRLGSRWFGIAIWMGACVASLYQPTTVSANPTKESKINEFAEELLEKGYRKVAVLPKVVVKKDKGKLDTHGDSVTGKIEPRTDRYVLDMRKALKKAMNERGGSVVSQFVTESRIDQLDFDAEDLLDAENVKELARVMGVDAVVFLEYVRRPNRPNERVKKVIGVAKKDNIKLKYLNENLEGSEKEYPFEMDVSLSQAAYSGDSWWIREWQGDRLVSRDLINPFIEKGNKIGTGQEWERVQFGGLYKDKIKHPLDIADFPYKVRIKVRDPNTGRFSYRKPTKFGNDYVVGLNDGDEYALEVANDTNRRIRMAVFIDGASNIDGHENKNVEKPIKNLPHELKQNQIYAFGPGSWNVRYWKSSASGKLKDFAKFKARTLDDPGKIGSSFLENVGMITVVFFADGTEGIGKPDNSLEKIEEIRSARRGLSAISPGLYSEMQKIDRKISLTAAANDIGPIMAAMTIYYRKTEYIAKAKDEGLDKDDPLAEYNETFLASKRQE